MPAPLTPPDCDGRLLGKPPRSMLIACAAHSFGMSEDQAEEMVDAMIDEHGLDVDLDR